MEHEKIKQILTQYDEYSNKCYENKTLCFKSKAWYEYYIEGKHLEKLDNYMLELGIGANERAYVLNYLSTK